MRNRIKTNWIFLFFCLLTFQVKAQENWNDVGSGILSIDTLKQSKYTLIFINKDAGLSPEVKQRLIEVFFEVYPKEVKTYNKSSLKKVVFIIDPGYKGVAATSGEIVRFNPEWFKKHPADVDVVTHEVMHIVQSYPYDAGPGWITEGIADYVRFKMGLDNDKAKWSLTEFKNTQSYTNAYRITARFFYWLELHQQKGIVKKLDGAMRNKEYSGSFWKENTGKTVDELWDEYTKNPTLF